jgi:methyltransferase
MMTGGVGFSVSSAPLLVLFVVMLMMLAESLVSRRHERMLRERGAVEPPGDVYATMRWAYPAAFIAMAAEGTLFGPPPTNVAVSGVVLMAAAKALKWWAMASLGVRWTFRVLVVPGAPLITHGPYAIWRHPNYIAVVGELVAMALMVGARVSGPFTTVLFSWLMWRRIRVEDRALRY